MSSTDKKPSDKPSDKKPRARPGRPRKVPEVEVEELGILSMPSYPDHSLELVYANPTVFKRVIQLFKNYGAPDVTFVFCRNKIYMVGIDHLGKTSINVKLDARYINAYYCKDVTTDDAADDAQVRITIARESLDRISDAFDRYHYKIALILRDDFRSIAYFILNDAEYENSDNYSIELLANHNYINYEVPDVSDYNIKFSVSSKHFKRKVIDIGRLSKIITIRKDGNKPLELTGESAKKIEYLCRYDNENKIKLRSDIEDDDIFSVSTFTEYIQPFATLALGSTVEIHADKHRNLCMVSSMDPKSRGSDDTNHVVHVCTVTISTEIRS